MSSVATRLREIVLATTPKLLELDEASVSRVPAPGKWSAKLVLGHLIDSAANNHPRIVNAQAGSDLVFASYDQEAWVHAQHYERADWSELVRLWSAYNLHLAHCAASIPDEVLAAERHPHSLDRIAWRTVPADEPVSLGYLIEDYLQHLEHHLEQIRRVVAAR
jgi:hypothetical protein